MLQGVNDTQKNSLQRTAQQSNLQQQLGLLKTLQQKQQLRLLKTLQQIAIRRFQA